MAYKPLLCVDFDGVIHEYVSGWEAADVIRDGPVPGAIEFLEEAVEHFQVAIFSARSNQPGGMDAMKEWLSMHLECGAFESLQWPTEKPPARVSIDDRALTFTGEWPDMQDLLDFKPWNKK